MRKNAATMTREELMHNARVFFLTAAIAVVVILVAFALVLAMEWPIAIAGVIAFAGEFFFLGGVGGGAYYLIRGLRRPEDWAPSSADTAMTGFSPERELHRLEKMIRSELGPSCGFVDLLERRVDEPWPSDPRSPWRHFVEATSLAHVQHMLCARIGTPTRELSVVVEVGRDLESPRARWVGLIFSAPCRASVGEWVWPPRDEDAELTAPASAELERHLRSILRSSSRFGGTGVNDLIVRNDVGFWIEPLGSESRAALVTLPQERCAGLKWQLGLTGFLAALEAIEHKGALDEAGAR